MSLSVMELSYVNKIVLYISLYQVSLRVQLSFDMSTLINSSIYLSIDLSFSIIYPSIHPLIYLSIHYYSLSAASWLNGRSISQKLRKFFWQISSTSLEHLTATCTPQMFLICASNDCKESAIFDTFSQHNNTKTI